MNREKMLGMLREKTEALLTWRKRRKLEKKEKLKKKNPVLDWGEAFLSAVVIVFFLNQYLLQAYQIPTESMVHTLEIGDRIFVDKLSYGPELLPGILKLPGFTSVKRGDIAIFESPEYKSKGTVSDIVARIIYMMTFSFIDLDRDENGEPAKHFLIKRVPAVSGDRLRIQDGFLEIRPQGFGDWIPESELFTLTGLPNHLNKRYFDETHYSILDKAGFAFACREAGIPVPPDYAASLSSLLMERNIADETELKGLLNNDQVSAAVYFVMEQKEGYIAWIMKKYFDTQYFESVRNSALSEIRPQDTQARKEWLKSDIGRYIPEGYIFPMGDNRDNSRDARFFGPVRLKKVLGKSLFRFWPFNRFGGV